MWEFRRRLHDLSKDDEKPNLEALFETLPELGMIYHFREELAEIFDTATDRTTAAARIEEWRRDLAETEVDATPVLAMLDRHRDGILAYFDEGKSSGVIEGLNNKARVVIKRCFGLKCVETLATRLRLDINRAADRIGRSIPAIRQLAAEIRRCFCGVYT